MTMVTCPKCSKQTAQGGFRIWQMIVSIFLFPWGLFSLLAGRKPTTCEHCGNTFGKKNTFDVPAFDVRAGCGPGFDGLVAEIIAIGKSADFTVPGLRTGAYDEECRHKRVLEIGKLLDAAGGMELMQAAAYRVRASGGDGRDLDRCWDGVGQWRQ